MPGIIRTIAVVRLLSATQDAFITNTQKCTQISYLQSMCTWYIIILSFVFSLFQCTAAVSGLLASVGCACRIQYDAMALHCLLPLLCTVLRCSISLYGSVVTTELAYLH